MGPLVNRARTSEAERARIEEFFSKVRGRNR
jgi:hypothetical protein